MEIEKKTWTDLFQKVIDGKKTFDIRLADFSCSPHDTLVLREWDPKKKQYTGRVLKKKVAYVLKTKDMPFWPKEDIEKSRLGLSPQLAVEATSLLIHPTLFLNGSEARLS